MSQRISAIVLGGMLLTVALLVGSGPAAAADDVHKVAIQVNSDDKKTVTIALNNAKNVIKHYGVGFVEVEIVAYGPGLVLFKKDSPYKDRLVGLNAYGNVHFGVCRNTMNKMNLTKEGLIAEAFVQDAIVPSGVVRLMELQEAGYSYIKP